MLPTLVEGLWRCSALVLDHSLHLLLNNASMGVKTVHWKWYKIFCPAMNSQLDIKDTLKIYILFRKLDKKRIIPHPLVRIRSFRFLILFRNLAIKKRPITSLNFSIHSHLISTINKWKIEGRFFYNKSNCDFSYQI